MNEQAKREELEFLAELRQGRASVGMFTFPVPIMPEVYKILELENSDVREEKTKE